MDGLVAGCLMAQVLALAVLLLAGARRIRPAGEPAGGSAAVSLVVPVAGWSAATEAGLASLLAQDHPDFEIVFVTENDADAAVPGLDALLDAPAAAGCRHRTRVTAGPADTCAQKNLNLLAGVRATDPGRPILAFCDAGHIAPPAWLRRLVAPLDDRPGAIATGYHDLRPIGSGVAGTGRALTVLVLRLLQLVPGLAQPWGGAMAMARSTFARLQLDDFWSRQVVDDVSLARRLGRYDAGGIAVSDAMTATPPGAGGLREWTDWLGRQLFFLRVHFPLAWGVGGVLGFAMALCVASAVWLVLDRGSVPAAAALVAFTALAASMRRAHPEPGGALRWAVAGWAALFVACYCHARSGLARRLVWRGIAYGVAADGSVRVSRSRDRSSSTRVPS